MEPTSKVFYPSVGKSASDLLKTKLANWERLKQQVQAFGALMKSQNLQLNVSESLRAREQYIQYPLEAQTATIKHFSAYFQLLTAVVSEGIGLRNNRQMAWASMRILGLRPLHDVFDKISDDDIVEIYNPEHVQIFRNLKFFELCSYSVFDILVFDWSTLYERDQSVITKIFSQSTKSLTTGRKTEYYDVPPHPLTEKFSEERRRFEITNIFHSPLFGAGEITTAPKAVLSTLKAMIIK